MLGIWRSSARWRAIWLAVAGAWVACSLGCDDAPPSPVIEAPDAAVCERGSEACSCVSGGGCRDGLLCIAGRCLASQDEVPDDVPLSRPTPPRPTSPAPTVVDAGFEGEPDGGPSTDAEAGAPVDSGAPASAADASLSAAPA